MSNYFIFVWNVVTTTVRIFLGDISPREEDSACCDTFLWQLMYCKGAHCGLGLTRTIDPTSKCPGRASNIDPPTSSPTLHHHTTTALSYEDLWIVRGKGGWCLCILIFWYPWGCYTTCSRWDWPCCSKGAYHVGQEVDSSHNYSRTLYRQWMWHPHHCYYWRIRENPTQGHQCLHPECGPQLTTAWNMCQLPLYHPCRQHECSTLHSWK